MCVTMCVIMCVTMCVIMCVTMCDGWGRVSAASCVHHHSDVHTIEAQGA
jgi:hypothetical protein